MQVVRLNKVIPKLRFKEFKDDWKLEKIKNITSIKAGGTPSTLKAEYWNGEIPWMNSGELNLKRIYDVKNRITKLGLNNSSTRLIPKECILIGLAGQGKTRGTAAVNYISLCTNQSIAAIYPNESFNTEFIYQYINSRYEELRRLSTGSGGRGGLNLSIIGGFGVPLPSLNEQQKIASFLSSVDDKLRQLTEKKDLLEDYKKGVIQKIFSLELRFKDDNGNNYPDWREKRLNEVLFEHKLKSTGKEEVYSVSVNKGLINQIKHLGRSFSAKNTEHYSLVKPNDIVYTKSPTGQFPYGIIKQAKISKDVIVSPLYGVFTPESEYLGYMLDIYFESKHNVHNYLHSIIQKGAKNTINITNSTFLSKSLKLPIAFDEQKKIGEFLKSIDSKIKLVSSQIDNTKIFKKGLLQQMFV